MQRKKLKKQKQIIVIGSLCLLLCLCVGYAAFQTQLSIRAKGNVKEKPNCEFGGIKVNTVVEGDGLYKDEYEEGKCTYKGANPNNYITFNNETWRIISIGSDNTIKIIRNESIGDLVWDDSNASGWIGNADWARPSVINSYLNDTYLPTITTNANKIVIHDFNIGEITVSNDDLAGQISDESSSTWNGKVGLITASEYIRANSNKEECGTYSLNNSNTDICTNTNWMPESMWTITPISPLWRRVVAIGEAYFSNSVYALDSKPTVPALYLNSNTQLSGNGSESDPYTIVE